MAFISLRTLLSQDIVRSLQNCNIWLFLFSRQEARCFSHIKRPSIEKHLDVKFVGRLSELLHC